LIVEDATECFTAMPDYVLIFKKEGENPIPVEHPQGLDTYFGATPILPEMVEKYGTYDQLRSKYKNWKDPKTNKLSHIIWQRYASSVWDDIRIDNVLKFKESRDEDDEKHVHPLQLDVILRLVELYSNKGEKVLTPFMGVGSEVYGAAALGRKGIGIELKDTYFKQATQNLKDLKSFNNEPQIDLFMSVEEEA
jgi:DNA modification methylase